MASLRCRHAYRVLSLSRGQFCRLPKVPASWCRLSASRVPAAMPWRVPGSPSAAGATVSSTCGDEDAERWAPLADAAGSAHPLVGTVVTISAPTATWAAVCSRVPASSRKPLPRVIISVVSCRVRERCGCPWRCPERHARPRGGRAFPNLPFPVTGGTCAGFGGSARFMRSADPHRSPAFLRAPARVPPAAEPQTRRSRVHDGLQQRGTAPRPSFGPVWREYPSRAAPCGRLGCPITPATGRIPPKGPKSAQDRQRQSAAFARENYSC